ncbi:MAG: hypothetical protein ACPGSC_13250 [Granulosicoccaceae bacterium]
MKTFYQLASAFVICIGLSACGANSMFEAESMETANDSSAQMKMAGKQVIPEGCISWFDGCNNCKVGENGAMACTKMACKSQTGEPACRAYAPGFGGGAAVEANQEEAPAPDTMPETQRDVTAEVPANCKIWFDGCNSCVVMRGKLRGCTSKSCTTQGTPSCTKSN